MCWQGLKETTKDADVVFLTRRDAQAFKKALLASGFIEDEIVTLDEGYSDMNTFGIFDEAKETPLDQEFTPGLRVDMFLKKVCGIISFSKGMRERCVKGFESGKIANMVCAPEDIFLFKSVTSRERDIDDMYTIIKGGIDYHVVEDELRSQTRDMGPRLGKAYSKIVFGRWRVIYERFGVKIPINPSSIKK